MPEDENLGTINAFWAHGNAVVIQHPNLLKDNYHADWGAHVQQESGENWFHFPITMLTYNMGYRMHGYKVHFVYKTEGAAFLTGLTVWDGHEKVFEVKDIKKSGSGGAHDEGGTFELPKPYHPFVRAGLLISAKFEFNKGSSVIFRGAGVDCFTAVEPDGFRVYKKHAGI